MKSEESIGFHESEWLETQFAFCLATMSTGPYAKMLMHHVKFIRAGQLKCSFQFYSFCPIPRILFEPFKNG